MRIAAGKAEIIRVAAMAAAGGLVVASGGNLSVRVSSETFLVTRTGAWFGHLCDDDIVLIDAEGHHSDDSAAPSSEWRLHARTYQQRIDVNAVVHVHPQFLVMLDAMKRKVRLVAMDHLVYVGKINRVGFFYNGSELLAEEAAHASVDADAVVLAYHGCSCLGDSLEMAYRRAVYLEQAAKMTYLMELAGDETAAFPADLLSGLGHA